MVDSRLAFDIMARDDGATAVLDKVARSADKTGLALKKTGKISDDVAKSSANLTKAHNRESDALDRVQVAEAKLAEVRGNSIAKSSQVLAAEKNLAKARRDAAAAGNVAQKAAKELGQALDLEGKKAGKSAGKSVLHWFTGAGKDFEKAGKVGGEGINSGIMGVLKTPVLGPALLAGAVAVVATAAPAAGAIVAGGIVAGFGAGLAGLGIVFAAKSAAVKDVWSKTLASMGADMAKLSKPFEGTLIAMAGVAKRTFAAFAPALGASFQKLAPAVTAFGDQLGRAFEKLVPAIGPLSDAFSAVLRSLGPAMQSAVGNISKGLQDLAASVQRSPEGLADLVKGLGDVTKATLDIITKLNDANAAFKDLLGASAVTAVMKAIEGSVRGAGLALDAITAPIILLNKLAGNAAPKVADLGKAATLTGGSAADMGAKVAAMNAAQAKTAAAAGTAGAALARSAHETHAANVAASLLAGTYDRQVAATNVLINGLNRLSGVLLSLSGAQVDYAQAVRDATQSIKDNGHTHNLATQAGINNQRSLLAVAQAAGVQRDAMLRANDGNAKAARAAETGRAAFIRLAVQMKYSKAEAEAMAAKFIAIPNVTRTAKLNANKKDLETKLAAAKTELANPNLTKERRAKLTADIANAKSGIATINGMLGNLPKSKTINILTKYTTVGSRSSGSGAGGGHIAPEPKASGGPVKKGSLYLVGEKRPELFVPKQDGTIIPKVPSHAMGQSVASGLAGGIAGGTSSAVSAAAGLANAVIAKAREVLGISSPSKVFTQLALFVAQGFNRGIRGSTASIQSAMSQMMNKVVNLGFSRVKQNRILRMLTMENKGLQAMANQRVVVANQLKAAQSRLAGAVQLRDEFRKNITDAALAFNSITNITPQEGWALTARDITERMQQTLAKTIQFARNLASLKKLGLRSDLYKQIAEAGIEAGGATADALLQGGRLAIGQVNSLQAQIANASAGLGNTAASNLYQAGVDAAQGLVNGLLAKTKALAAAAKKLADAIVAQVKKTLGIKSPSKVLMWHGSMAGQGFAQGIEGEYGRVRKAGVGLSGAAVNRQLTPRARSMTAAGSASAAPIVLEFRSDGSPHMNWLVGEFRKYIRINGGDVQAVLGR